jgi:hypothetical protein
VAWFPPAPREVYRPSYPVSRAYFDRVNRSNTVINNTVINNTYNNINVTNTVYANRHVSGAVVAVPTTVFVQSQPVSKAAHRAPRALAIGGPVYVTAPIAPTKNSVHGDAREGGKPPSRAFERTVVTRSAPPPAQAGFAAQEPQLTAEPGHPLDEAARKQLQPAAAAPTPSVRVLPKPQDAPRALPPTVTAVAQPRESGARPTESKKVPDTPKASGKQRTPETSVPVSPARDARPPAQQEQAGQQGKPEAGPAAQNAFLNNTSLL